MRKQMFVSGGGTLLTKTGFTLIELLAVIVILAVLALIATPIVLNIIDDSKESATLRSSENYIKAVEFSIAKSVMENKKLSDGTYNLMSNGNICLGTKSGNTCDNELVVEVSGETPESGTITIKSRKIDSYEFTYASGFVVINGEINSEDTKVCKLTLDGDDDGVADTGDMITCSTESFHVIENDGTTISMLVQYNLDVGYYVVEEDACIYSTVCDEYDEDGERECYTVKECPGSQDTYYNYYGLENPSGIQKYNTQGVVEFSIDNYWGTISDNEFIYRSNIVDTVEQSLVYPYVETYEQYLIAEGVTSAKGTLISYEQLIDLKDNKGNPDWLYTTSSYWTGSSLDSDTVLLVSPGGLGGDSYRNFYENIGYHSVRPVINISVNEL